VSDPAHVTQGQRGDHVGLIQYALMRVLVADLPQAETSAKLYGPATAAAVLRYKRALGIINRSYQNKADNIVGKMTMKSLDKSMWVLEGGDNPPRLPSTGMGHPQSPPPVPATPATKTFAAAGTVPAKAAPTGSGFQTPLADLPGDLQEAIRRSNDVKKPGQLILFPFLAEHEGPQSGAELSNRFKSNPSAMAILVAVFGRMNRFGFFSQIKHIYNVFQGVGSKGFQCEPFDHGAFLLTMEALTRGRTNFVGVRDSKFCRDKFNVHGPRDSFREIVNAGEGLHICITQPASRATVRCDCHIDEVQQGQICFDGYCVPLVNRQTAEHVRSVGPWLAAEAKKKVVDWGKKLKPW
jgi:hypothetical protein